MKEKNLEYLEKQLFYTGFGDISKQELREQMEKGRKEFQLEMTRNYGDDTVKAGLNFKLSDQGNYFFNSYDLKLEKPKGELVEQTFRINYGNTFTFKEAYNLLDGRSVNKDFLPMQKQDENGNRLTQQSDENGKLKTYNAWAYLDMTQKDQQGNFLIKKKFNYNLEEALSKYPIKEASFQQSYTELVESLKKGNRQMANFVDGEKTQRVYIEAAPTSRNDLNIYDSNMKRQLLSERKQNIDKSPSVNEDRKEMKSVAKEEKQKEGERPRRRMKVS